MRCFQVLLIVLLLSSATAFGGEGDEAPAQKTTIEIHHEVSDSAPEPKAHSHHFWGCGEAHAVEAQAPLPFYVDIMVLGGVLIEDEENRLTKHDSKTLEGFGAVLRTGAVLDHHLIGVHLEAFARPTHEVIGNDDPELFGIVGQATVGAEYRYLTDIGFYFGGVLGAGVASTHDRFEESPCGQTKGKTCLQWIESESAGHTRMVWGTSAKAVVGYQLRFNPWFTMSVEAYGSYFRGLDDAEDPMTLQSGGVAFGLGM